MAITFCSFASISAVSTVRHNGKGDAQSVGEFIKWRKRKHSFILKIGLH